MRQFPFYPVYYPIYYHRDMRQNDSLKSYYQQSDRQFPGVDATLLEHSAKSMQNLMKDASIVLNKLAESKPFATKIMSAAQHSNMTEVNELIKSTGIKSKVETSFNPDGINFKLSSKVGDTDCCHLTIALRWS